MQKSYLGKVKMIYIDPPYNTGNDFIYPDDYTENLQTYLEYTGQVDAVGKKFNTNTEVDGRFHSKWLNMMYPRLYLGRNLLRDDGIIFVSVDDHEVNNLRVLLNEVFGEECFSAQIVVVNNLKGRNDRKDVATAHEYVLMYSRENFESLGLPLTNKQVAEYREADDEGLKFQWRDLRKRGGADTRTARPKLFFPIYADPESGSCSLEKDKRHSVEILPKKIDNSDGCWRWGIEKVRDNLANLNASKVQSNDRWNVNYRVYLEANGKMRVAKPKSVWFGPEVSTDAATKTLRAIMGTDLEFTPKPVELLKTIAVQSLDEDDICADFFAGSGTMAQALLELNTADGGSRKFILIQLPEPTGRKDYPTIADIMKERVRRIIKKLNDEDAGKLELHNGKQERGFKVFRLAESNFQSWNPNVARPDVGLLEKQLEIHVNHLRDNRTDDDLLYEILLKSGYPLTTRVETVNAAGKTFYSVAEGLLLVCLDKELTHDLIKAMADRKPERVVCLDEGFAGNDQLKTNAVQTMKVKGVTSFKTV